MSPLQTHTHTQMLLCVNNMWRPNRGIRYYRDRKDTPGCTDIKLW